MNGEDIVPKLKDLVDSVHVSLNTADPGQWLAMMRPGREYAQKGFSERARLHTRRRFGHPGDHGHSHKQ